MKDSVFTKPFLILLTFFLSLQTYSQSPNTDWFEDARYGMFIHWGLYSAAEGLWKGEKLRYMNDYAEWIRYRNRISKEEYGELAQRFDWDKIDPEEWVIQAKKAGMKYIIMTAKHHDGVAIWDTEVNDYSLPKLSGSGRDIIAELAEACRKHNIKLGFYYSHWIDWVEPYGWNHNQELTGRVTDEQFDSYWQGKVIPQIKELLTEYGDVALFWFDMWIPYQKSIIKKKQLVQLAKLIRKYQPDALINSRLGLPPSSAYVDFETLGDNVFGEGYIDHPWETPGTIAHSWGYNGQETQWKSIAQIFNSLIGNVSLNGGYTLNIGPRADGSIPYESQTRLNEIGSWLKQYGEAVYGNTGLALRQEPDWGKLTYNPERKMIYAHIFNWPLDKLLRLTGIKNTPKNIQLLRQDGSVKNLEFDQFGPILHIHLPDEAPDPYDAVIRIEVEDSLKLNKQVVAESSFGGFSLRAKNMTNASKDLDISPYDGKRPEFVKVTNEKLEWNVFLPQKGTYKIDISAHNPNEQTIPVQIQVGSQTLKANLDPDGRVVAEPNQNNYTDEFVDRHLGKIEIDKPEKLTVKFSSKEEKEVWLNYIWIEAEN